MGKKISRIGRTTWMVVFGLIVCGLLLGGLAYGFAVLSGVELSVHGWGAIGLGITFSLALSGVLFGLSFYSARSGHDDEIGLD